MPILLPIHTVSSDCELLAPAGNPEKLRFAVHYGADAVYFGLKQFSLRNFADNFDLDDADRGISYLHRMGRKGYCALNIFPFEDEYAPLIAAAKALDDMGVDGLIVSDIGVISELKRASVSAPIHVSTQANTVSPQTIRVLKELGASRVNLARELSFAQIKSLQIAVADLEIETEVFVHGSVCFSYSGRCAVSDYLTGRRANQGACTQACRWKYSLVEEKRPGIYLPVLEDERGLYFFNSKDLALFPFVPSLREVGVHSFKIEGRMKSIHYLASVVSLYRRILDGASVDVQAEMPLLHRVKSRGYSLGFMKGGVGPSDYNLEESNSVAESVFIGDITEHDVPGKCVMNIRNKTFAGDAVEILRTDGSVEFVTLPSPLVDVTGESMTAASHGKLIELPFPLPPFSIVRKVKQ